MHEMAVTKSIAELASKKAAEAGAEHVTDIYLVIGDLSSFVDESIQFYWDILCAGTAVHGAKLHFRRVAALLYCGDCAIEYTPAPGELLCPACGGARITLRAGDEFYLEAIEVE